MGDGYCWQNLKSLLGQSLWQEAGDAGMKHTGETRESCVCMCVCVCLRVCVCWGKGVVAAGDKGLSEAGEPMRGRITSGMGRSVRTEIYTDFSALVHSLPFPPKSLPGLLQQQLTGP